MSTYGQCFHLRVGDSEGKADSESGSGVEDSEDTTPTEKNNYGHVVVDANDVQGESSDGKEDSSNEDESGKGDTNEEESSEQESDESSKSEKTASKEAENSLAHADFSDDEDTDKALEDSFAGVFRVPYGKIKRGRVLGNGAFGEVKYLESIFFG
jgi:hypothetical protein